MAIEVLGNTTVDSNGNIATRRRASYVNKDSAILDNSNLVKTGAGKIASIIVSSAASTPTLKLWDSTAASTTVLVSTFTPVAATVYNFGADVEFSTGLYVSVGGSVQFTVFYQ